MPNMCEWYVIDILAVRIHHKISGQAIQVLVAVLEYATLYSKTFKGEKLPWLQVIDKTWKAPHFTCCPI